MKRSKKLLSLVMAMLMAFSLMAVTAAAYGEGHEHDCAVCSEEEIARKPAMWCPQCGASASVIGKQPWTEGHSTGYLYTFDCPNCGTVHHFVPSAQ